MEIHEIWKGKQHQSLTHKMAQKIYKMLRKNKKETLKNGIYSNLIVPEDHLPLARKLWNWLKLKDKPKEQVKLIL